MAAEATWPVVRLGNHAYIKGRIGWRGLTSSEYTDEGPYLIAGQHLTGGLVDWATCDHLSVYRYEESHEIALKQQDIILTKDGTIGRVAFIDRLPGPTTINSTMMLVRSREPIQPKFLYHYLTGHHFQKLVADKVSGSSIPHIFQRDMVNLTVPLPSEAEQHRIAEILDAADDAIRQTERVIAKLRQVKAGLLHDLLTRGLDARGRLRNPAAHPEEFKESPLGRIPREWEVCPIEEELERIIDYRGRTPTKTKTGIPLITAKNVRDGFFDPEPREYIAEESYDDWMTRGIPTAGDVLFTTEAPLGNVARLPGYKVALAQRILTLCAKPETLHTGYLFWLLRWSYSRRRLELRSTGSTVVGIKQSVFRKVSFQFPPLEEQHRIAVILDAADARIRTEEATLAKLRQVKRGLMDDLLTGRVRVL